MMKGTTVGNERLVALFDAGTFVETGAYVTRDDGELTGVVCGYGAIGGKLVFAFAQDSDRKKGAFDALQAEKITSLYGMAMKNGAPVIALFDSAGAVLCDGSSAMSAYGKLLKVVSDASGVIPQIALISGVCSGLAATVAAAFDLTVTVKDLSKLFVNAPFLIGKEVGSAEYTAQNGMSDLLAESESDAVAKIRRLITLLPSNNAEGVLIEETNDDVNRRVAIEGVGGKELASALVDAGELLELGAEYAPEMITAIASVGGVTCGVIANDPAKDGGVLTASGAKKAAHFVSFCDSLSIPIVTLVDSVGVEESAVAESENLAAALGKLAMAYASADTAKITAICKNAYGAAFTLMGSKALGADMVFALPSSTVSVMDPASAVAFLWNDRITADTTRAALENEWRETQASAVRAARDGSVDDVIAPEELRQRICAAVYMLMAKSAQAPARKHCNLPL